MEQVHSMAQLVSDKSDRMSNVGLIERVFALLRVVAATAEGATVTQLAKETGLPKSTVSRLLAALEQVEAVTRASAGHGFTIGPGLVALVAQVPHPQTLSTIARPYLQALQEAIGETVALTLPEGDDAYVALQLTSHHAIQVRDWTGVRIPMYVQSTGRVFLAARPDEALARYLAGPLHPYTAKTIVTPTDLQTELDRVRADGYAWVSEEFEEGLTAVAAPVYDGTGHVVAAVNAFGPTFRFPATGQQATITRQVIAAAQQIAVRLSPSHRDA